MCLLLFGCGAESTEEATLTVTDDLGRTVEISRTLSRVVTLAPSVTEIIFTAGAGAHIVGVTTADNYPPAVNVLPKFSALPVDFEAIAALDPDLVLASDQVNSPQDASTMEEVGIPVYFVGVRTLDDVMDAIVRVGQLLGTAAQAARAADSLQASLNALEELTRSVTERPRTLFLVSDVTSYAFGKGSYMHSLIALAGGISITETHEVSAPILSDEYVLTSQVEVIIGAFGPDYTPETILSHHPTWDIVPAVHTGRVYGVSGDAFVRPGPRLISGAWQMAALLHPDRVAMP